MAFTTRLKSAWSALTATEKKQEGSGPYSVPLSSFAGISLAGDSPASFDGALRAAFETNVIGFKCASMLASAVATLDFYVTDLNDNELPEHELQKRLEKPNPLQGRNAFLSQLIGTRLLAGVSYVEPIAAGTGVPTTRTPPRELWSLRPDRVRVDQTMARLPTAYEYTPGGFGEGSPRRFPVNQVNGACDLFISRSINLSGSLTSFMSPARAAWLSLSAHSTAFEWNNSLLANSARPSGAFAPRAPSGDQAPYVLDAVAIAELRKQVDEQYVGAGKSGRPILLSGPLEFLEMGLSPKDMDWANAIDVATRHICLAFGVPPLLMNIGGDNTYANMAEARQALYQETVLPLAREFLADFNAWAQQYWPGVKVCIDEDSIIALTPSRKEKWDAVSAATFLSINEKRVALGYERVKKPAYDEVLVPAGLLPLGDEPALDETAPDLDADTATETE